MNTMNFDQELQKVADSYRSRGFKVVVRPGADDLPAFAKDFKVELVATRDDGSALVSAKSSPSELQADPNFARYVEVTDKQPGWRFDIVVLGPDRSMMPAGKEAKEPSVEEIRRGLADAEGALRAGFVAQSFIYAWALLESVMRRRLQATGQQAGWGISQRTILNELLSAGALNNSVFRDLEQLFQLRNAIAHGFSVPDVSESSVRFLLETARQLLTESQPIKQPA